MIGLGDLRVLQSDDGRVHAVEQQGNGTRGVGLKSELGHVIHELHLIHVFARASGIERHLRLHHRLWFALPFTRHFHPLF